MERYKVTINRTTSTHTMMNDIFQDLIAEGHVCVYLDDILIFTETLEEHRQLLQIVLDRLRLHKLYLCPEKCEFECTRIEYLGLIVSEGRVEMDPVKVAGVAEWPRPANQKEVQSFLGFANFYCRFIQGFSNHACSFSSLQRRMPSGCGVMWSSRPLMISRLISLHPPSYD